LYDATKPNPNEASWTTSLASARENFRAILAGEVPFTGDLIRSGAEVGSVHFGAYALASGYQRAFVPFRLKRGSTPTVTLSGTTYSNCGLAALAPSAIGFSIAIQNTAAGDAYVTATYTTSA
jgi:hypothetical protein